MRKRKYCAICNIIAETSRVNPSKQQVGVAREGCLSLHYACCGASSPGTHSTVILASSVQLNRTAYDKIALGTTSTKHENPDCELIAVRCRLDFTIKILWRDQKS